MKSFSLLDQRGSNMRAELMSECRDGSGGADGGGEVIHKPYNDSRL